MEKLDEAMGIAVALAASRRGLAEHKPGKRVAVETKPTEEDVEEKEEVVEDRRAEHLIRASVEGNMKEAERNFPGYPLTSIIEETDMS